MAHDLIPSGLLWAPIYIKLNKVELSSRCSVFCFYGFLPPFLQVQSWRWCIMTRQFWKTTISLWASNCCRRKTVTSSRTSARNRETLSARWWLTWWERFLCDLYYNISYTVPLKCDRFSSVFCLSCECLLTHWKVLLVIYFSWEQNCSFLFFASTTGRNKENQKVVSWTQKHNFCCRTSHWHNAIRSRSP